MNTDTLREKGFEIIETVYSKEEVADILHLIHSKELGGHFGIREFLFDHPEITAKVFNTKLLDIITGIAPDCELAIKSIFFDKPPQANWIVNWHQDLTINLKAKNETQGYKNWRVKNERTVVQPSLDLLENIFTIRIHLDDCNKENGALRVIEGSHTKGVINIKEWMTHQEGKVHICEVQKGGILIMKPLILHASRRTNNERNRRVIHVEFTDQALPNDLQWKEAINFRKMRKSV